MIYLIDDNQNNQRQTQYNVHYIDSTLFKDVLITIEKIPKNFDSTLFRNAKCILLHATTEDIDENGNFISGSITNAINIKETITNFGKNIPLVLFSNGINENLNSNEFISIKKNRFYENLFSFLTSYVREGIIDIRIIASGRMYKAIELSKHGNILLNKVNMYDSKKRFHPSLLDGLNDLRSFHSLALNKNNFQDFLNNLEDNPISIGKFKKQIRNIIDSYIQYNENIYNWE